jgi:hypothetical protein
MTFAVCVAWGVSGCSALIGLDKSYSLGQAGTAGTDAGSDSPSTGGSAGIGGTGGSSTGGSSGSPPDASGGAAASVIMPVEYECVGGSSCASPGASSAAVLFQKATTSGELVWAFSAGGPTGTAYGSVTDSASQIYTQDSVVRKTDLASHIAVTFWYKCGSTSGVNSLTWTYGSGDTEGLLIAGHVKGISSSGCRDAAANFLASASNTPYTSAPATPIPGQSEWMVGLVAVGFGTNPSSLSATAPWTLRASTAGSGNPIGLMDQVVTTTSGSYVASGTGAESGAIYFPAILTFH